MLVLSRKVNETVFIEVDGLDKPIEVTLVFTAPHKARLGFVGEPHKVRIYREEIYREVLQQRIENPELHKGSSHASNPV